MTEAIFFRLLKDEDKASALGEAITAPARHGGSTTVAYTADPQTFGILPDSPFVYWAGAGTIRKLAANSSLEPTAASVRQGLSTSDNFRFVRALWEVRPSNIRVFKVGAQSDVTTGKWAFLVMTGAAQPWFSPITVVVNWARSGDELREFRGADGKPKAVIRNPEFHFRRGISWVRRAVRFIPYAIPSGCLSTASRYMAFPFPGREFEVLGLVASNVATALLRFYGEWNSRPNFLVANVKQLPWPNISTQLREQFELFIREQVQQRRSAYQQHEPFQEFTIPLLCGQLSQPDALAFDPRSLLGKNLEVAVANAYGLTDLERAELERDMLEAIELRAGAGEDEGDREMGSADEDDDRDLVVVNDARTQHEAVISYAIGCAFGRWDVRLARDQSLIPRLGDVFEPLPACPPGMLLSADCLPASANAIVSEEWLRARPDAITPPPEGSVRVPTLADSAYPLELAWDGILVDDPEHPRDVIARVRAAGSALR